MSDSVHTITPQPPLRTKKFIRGMVVEQRVEQRPGGDGSRYRQHSESILGRLTAESPRAWWV